jgi:aminoglycoside phosphotransferase (APT) family kinase protein
LWPCGTMPGVTPACRAAADIAAKYGIRADSPLLLQETNNTVVWLRPSDVIAKVGTRADSLHELQREYEVARDLAAFGAPVASPLVESPPTTDPSTGFIVTLWNRLEREESAEPPASAVAESLKRLHQAMDACTVELPDFRVDIRRSRRILQTRSRIPALAAGDRALLQQVFDALLPTIDASVLDSRPLHGEPHEGNRVPTPFGIRWIDFESACRGPVEWDLAFLPEEARGSFSTVDEDLLAVLSVLNSARVATWCSVQARFPVMRRHAEYHLGRLRRDWPT